MLIVEFLLGYCVQAESEKISFYESFALRLGLIYVLHVYGIYKFTLGQQNID